MGTGASNTNTGAAAAQGPGTTAGQGGVDGGIGRFIGADADGSTGPGGAGVNRNGGGGGGGGSSLRQARGADPRDSFLNPGHVPEWNQNDTKPNVRFQDAPNNRPRHSTTNAHPSNAFGTTTMRRTWGSEDVTVSPQWQSENTNGRQQGSDKVTTTEPTTQKTSTNNRRGLFDWIKRRKAKSTERKKVDSEPKSANAGKYDDNFPGSHSNTANAPLNRQSNTPYPLHRDRMRMNDGTQEPFDSQSSELVPYVEQSAEPHRYSSGQGNLVYPLGEDQNGRTHSYDMNRNQHGVFTRYMDVRGFQDKNNTVVYRNIEQYEVSSLGGHYHAQRREQRVVNDGRVDDPWAPIGGQRQLQPERKTPSNQPPPIDTAHAPPPTDQAVVPLTDDPRLSSYDESEQTARHEDSGKLDLNLRFYRNDIKFRPDGEGILEVHNNWFGNYQLLEHNRVFIHWLFPLPNGDPVNSWTQPLQDPEARAIWGDKTLRNRVKMSYNLMLDLFGMILKDQRTGDIGRTKDWRARYDHFVKSDQSKHRVTRILRSLGALGFGGYQTPFVLFLLHEVLVTKQLAMLATDDCIDDWIDSIRDLNERATVKDFYDQYKHSQNSAVSGYGQASMSKSVVPRAGDYSLANTETPSLLHSGYRVYSQ